MYGHTHFTHRNPPRTQLETIVDTQKICSVRKKKRSPDKALREKTNLQIIIEFVLC